MKQNGLTLVEMMVAMTLGLLVSSAVGALFIQSSHNKRQNDELSYVQQNGQYALNMLASELMMSDFFGGIQLPSLILTDASGTVANIDTGLDQAHTGCSGTGAASVANWNYDFNTSIAYIENTISTDIDDIFTCVTSVTDNTDVLMVKRARGLAQTSSTNLTDGRVYIRTNSTIATVHKMDTGTTDPASDFQDWEYLAHIYYVENNQLKRQTLKEDNPTSNDPRFVEEILADGIEQFHIMFGIDLAVSGTLDGKADYFTSDPQADIANAVVARIYVLARSESEITGYSNVKKYQLGDKSIAITTDTNGNPDGFYRKVFSTSVAMRNPISQQQFN